MGIQQQLNNPPEPDTNLKFDHIGDDKNGKINIPNSMWTAGCCVRPLDQKTESFAVIGNNVNDKLGTLTQQVTVKELQDILEDDVHTLNNVNLFPGNLACANEYNNVPSLPGRIKEV